MAIAQDQDIRGDLRVLGNYDGPGSVENRDGDLHVKGKVQVGLNTGHEDAENFLAFSGGRPEETEAHIAWKQGPLRIGTATDYNTFDTEILRITDSGSVGIGTLSSEARLNINSGWGNWLFLRQDPGGGGFLIHNPKEQNRLEIGSRQPDGQTKWGQMVLQAETGNVGVGTTNPGSKLEVAGDINYHGQQNQLKVADKFTATVRAADFLFGYSGRKGTITDQDNVFPGRALVDNTTTLVINYASDWTSGVLVASDLCVDRNLRINGTVDGDVQVTGQLSAGFPLAAKTVRPDPPPSTTRDAITFGSLNIHMSRPGTVFVSANITYKPVTDNTYTKLGTRWIGLRVLAAHDESEVRAIDSTYTGGGVCEYITGSFSTLLYLSKPGPWTILIEIHKTGGDGYTAVVHTYTLSAFYVSKDPPAGGEGNVYTTTPVSQSVYN